MVLDFIVDFGFFFPIPTKGGSGTAGARMKLLFPLEGKEVVLLLLIVVTEVAVVAAVIVNGSGTIALTL
jgi:hypothetical protein